MTSTPNRKNGISSLWNFLKIALAFGLVIYVLSKSDLPTLWSTLQNASVFWLVISGVLYFALTLLKALQYAVLMPGRLTYPQVLNVTIWQNAISNFFLAGAGIAAYITMTRLEHEVKVSRSVTIFLLTKVGDLIAIWVTLLVASKLVWSDIGLLRAPVIFLILGIGECHSIVLSDDFFATEVRFRLIQGSGVVEAIQDQIHRKRDELSANPGRHGTK